MSNLLCAVLPPPDWLALSLPANESMFEMMDELTRVDPELEKQEGGCDRLGSSVSISMRERGGEAGSGNSRTYKHGRRHGEAGRERDGKVEDGSAGRSFRLLFVMHRIHVSKDLLCKPVGEGGSESHCLVQLIVRSGDVERGGMPAPKLETGHKLKVKLCAL